MNKKTFAVLFTGLLILAATAQIVQAQILFGPPLPNGYPQWVVDGNGAGTKLQPCLQSRNPRDPEAGPCEFEVRGQNFIEVPYWAAEADIEDADFARLQLIMAVAAETIPGAPEPPEPIGQVVFSEMRFRMEPAGDALIEGTYTVSTPFGTFDVVVDAATAVSGVDVSVGRAAAGGALEAGIENFVAIPAVPRGTAPGLPAGTELVGPITNFPRALQAPIGFIGDIGEIPVPVEPGDPAPRAPRIVNPGPEATGPQRLVNAPSGSTFRVSIPASGPVPAREVGEPADQTLFTVAGSIFEDAGADAIQAEFAAPAARGAPSTLTVGGDGVVSNVGFTPVLPAPAADADGDFIAGAPAPAVFNFTGRRVQIPQSIAVSPAGSPNDPPGIVDLTNPASAPIVTRVNDTITGTATLSARGGLTIRAQSSFRALPAAQRPTLTASIDGGAPQPLSRAGRLTVRGLGAPPAAVTITSSAGGTLTINP